MTDEKPMHEIGWSELARVIFKAKGIDSGLWRFGLKLRFAATGFEFVGPQDNSRTVLPGSMAAIEAVVMSPAESQGDMVFDAAAATADPGTPSGKPKPARKAARSRAKQA